MSHYSFKNFDSPKQTSLIFEKPSNFVSLRNVVNLVRNSLLCIVRKSLSKAQVFKMWNIQIVFKISTPYHSQTNEKAEVFNREVKNLLQKLVQSNRRNWSRLLDEAFWTQRTTYWTPLGMSPFRLIFGK